MSELMTKYIGVELPDGSIVGVPVAAVAMNRARHYADEFGGSLERSLSEDTLPLFEEDSHELMDWAVGNMNWDDFPEDETVMLRPAPKPDMQEAWVSGEKSIWPFPSTD